MVITKSRKGIVPKDDSADNSNQVRTLPLTTLIIKPTMKFDSALQHILDTVLELRQEHCICLCFNNAIQSQEVFDNVLSFNRFSL